MKVRKITKGKEIKETERERKKESQKRQRGRDKQYG